MITIITVVYNAKNTIKKTLESVCNQTLQPFEYLIIDGMSDDGTISIIEEYESLYPFVKLISEKDNGIYDAMNKGINLAKGELIGILNSDDWYEPNALEAINRMFNLHKSGVYYGIQRNILHGKEFYLERVNQEFIGTKMIQHPCTFVSKDVYVNNGIFNLRYKYSADLDFIIRLVKAGVSFYHSDQIITNFQIGGASSTPRAALESITIRYKHGYIKMRSFLFKWFKLQLKLIVQ